MAKLKNKTKLYTIIPLSSGDNHMELIPVNVLFGKERGLSIFEAVLNVINIIIIKIKNYNLN